jgi:hypothetical protein
MGNKHNQISVSWFLKVIVFLCLIETLTYFVNGAQQENGFGLIYKDNARTTTNTAFQFREEDGENGDGDENVNLSSDKKTGSGLHNAIPSFSSKINDVSKAQQDQVLGKKEGDLKMVERDHVDEVSLSLYVRMSKL